MSKPLGRSIDLRLYLEGIRVPIRSISVAAGVNNHISANIDIPPTPLSTELKARTLAHVFYKSSLDSNFKLLFEGEVIGISAAEDTKSKSTTLVCTDLTNYWNFVWMYFLNRISPSAYAGVETAAFAAGRDSEGNPLHTGFNLAVPEELTASLVLSAFIQARSDVQKALLNIIFLMANTGGDTVGNLNSPRLNSFLEKAFVNLRLGERVFILPDDEIRGLIDMSIAQSVLDKSVGDLGNFSSLSELINRFLGFVYYSWVAMPCPSFTERSTDGSGLDYYNPVTTSGATSASSRKTTVTEAINRKLETDKVLRSVVFKPQTYFLPAPTCNFFFPSMFDTFSSTRMFLQEPTRLRVQSHPIPGTVSNINSWNTACFYAPAELGKIIQETEVAGGTGAQSGQARGVDGFDSTANQEDRSAETNPAPPKSTLRYENLIEQTGAGEINEKVTGIIPAFEELGWAEYAALGIDAPLGTGKETPEKSAAFDAAEDRTPQNSSDRQGVEQQQETRKPSESTAQTYLTEIAQYKLDMKRYAPRTVEGIRGPYNPNVALGFPGIVFTKRGIFAGEVSSVNHICSASAQAFTSITLGFARSLSMIPGIFRANNVELNIFEAALRASSADGVTTLEGFRSFVSAALSNLRADNPEEAAKTSISRLDSLTDGFDPADRIAESPAWLNFLYEPENIGVEVYQKLFGKNTRSLVDLVSYGVYDPNQVLAANYVLVNYLKSENKIQYATEMTSRDIASASEVMKDYLGAANAPKEKPFNRAAAYEPDDLVKGIPGERAFNPTRVSAVRSYINHITGAKGKAFRG